jgi:hypothetical protein
MIYISEIKIKKMSKELKVTDNFRTNPESLLPGGSIVEVHQADGLILLYDKIKNPNAYISKIVKTQAIIKVMVGGKLYWEKQKGFDIEMPEASDSDDDLPF